ncbi:ATP synthase subunit I [Clostridium celatum]|uniref:Putative ATP synthase F0, I subunit n=1 Tax=Clostridium celatum DSM 1785 TaxID=545697 RepID=L1QI53_9CLOT|nr:ATP synthase subunit I [Clostridium celatum]EKY27658.1 putative ATP synthase F0, I subunit [Clostridium celatum DSM 1785]MCE9655622.1 ATP synthase subunit I [Clostridium celatum]MDU2266051.1 ATP synthase subunit I [Clostridium celatum]MDU3722138.1 ATP synthase subunit I [Clostridium celatum]MDU6296999.1 ATP synthase subunit I [Clostridium celatum]
MPKDLKNIIKSVANNNLISGIVVFLILVLLKQYNIGLIILIGLIVSMLNFIVSAIITSMYLSKLKKNKAILFPLSYLIRIVIIVAIAVVFSNRIENLLAFLLGFIIHYVILGITTIKVQKGSG